MNDRIKQLASRCRIETYGVNGELLYEGFDEEKFAELIVKECVSVTEEYRGTEWGKAAECIGDAINEHFGVE